MDTLPSVSGMRDALRDPSVAFNKLRQINRRMNEALYADRFGEGFDVMSADWDNLIILDGCRYDVFEAENDLDGDLSPIVSQGGHSEEFMRKTFDGRQFHDTVYITANPYIEKQSDDIFFTIRTTYDESDQSGKMRLPEDVAELALNTFDEFDDKRYIVHFMQPNNPYVGPKAAELRARVTESEDVIFTEMESPSASDLPKSGRIVQHLRRALKRGYITRDEMLDVYRENLGIVLDHAREVMSELGGKTVITADHGDMFGERLPPLYLREYSHWRHTYADELRNVPWLVVESEQRRSVTAEEPIEYENMATSHLEGHLEAMGYLSD
ncbi:hypothetical protein [Halorientalis regularis]|uniref:Sulfatase n=1 Tax=Halorientalis regularis TaxID=660518 RepID=A0A1G7TSN2_9EURY|nr:hypothetical protein [Halorientalis regularis]SDG38258.1 hypothetical protein SAMN05216218_12912 [Halorientalis regularis]